WGYDLDERFKLIRQFGNQVGFANALKYKLSGGKDHSYVNDIVIGRLKKMGLSVRGHTLIWPGWKHMHKDSLPLKNNKKALSDYCHSQIEEFASLWDVSEWDVMNEPRANHDIQDILGTHSMVDWYQTAKKYLRNKDAHLYLNDYQVISHMGSKWEKHIGLYHDTAKYLLDNGAPLTHLGFQSRFKAWVESEEIYRRLEEFRDLNLPVKATEFEIRSTRTKFTEQERARYTEQIMTTYFSHDLVCGFIAWTFFTEEGKLNPQDNSPEDFSLFYTDRIKPNGKVWLHLVRKHWNTDEVLKTNESGQIELRGFLGDYEVLIGKGKSLKRAQLTLDHEKNEFVVQI
ncbi:MAG: endo-1,4-beta-xylanase, partial [Planctomycetes bacterium]|nr:endo-1,4-beta-xylanase [Planctomycetota bacterium]